MPIRNRLAEMHDDITAWRHNFHMHPELLYDTHRTSGIVADKLHAFGCDEVVTGIGRTGVVGLIHGKTNTSGRTIGLRADMDALPMTEATGADHASTVPGKMHACGHDGHTAMLLGAAQYLSETRNFDGTVAVIFQPAEEGGAGALAMVEDGLIDRFGISEVYGMHNSPLLPEGAFAIRSGPFYAACDIFEITVTGKGGHGARPNNVIDTTLAASALVMNLQSVVSRNTDPQQAAVVSVTSFRTESEAFNVIPETVTLRGTVRSFDAAVRKNIEARLKSIAALTAETYGATAEVDWPENGYPIMSNHPAETDFAAMAAQSVAGDCDTQAPRTTGGEDFAYMLQACPGAYIQIGNGPSKGLHHPEYDFNDAIIPTGASYWVTLAEQRLPA
ncbi:M20 aminoacylase family protein [Yoonia sediminilitoris]|uniref:Hippurate hydrolase n=1 Tax=Yoonia sediminilitoris TaxID=1286148 RepID=A0A2T6KRG4_9RHOB|nr:M20 aminoacylase family protein [Yoonia sediminilitoris]PUB19151.1 hippurate hydrolase [Yoonia sediminilitoris]RCW99319.1 hippurate hydrolase [Yoonia sediminilitoris]